MDARYDIEFDFDGNEMLLNAILKSKQRHPQDSHVQLAQLQYAQSTAVAWVVATCQGQCLKQDAPHLYMLPVSEHGQIITEILPHMHCCLLAMHFWIEEDPSGELRVNAKAGRENPSIRSHDERIAKLSDSKDEELRGARLRAFFNKDDAHVYLGSKEGTPVDILAP